MSYDVIIVGSGVSGLTAAILLAKEGMKVLVLEQYKRPGGLMLDYYRKGTRFPTGVHCLGSLGKGEVLWAYLKYLRVLDYIQPVPMDPKAFNVYSFPEKEYYLPYCKEAFQEYLIQNFPKERECIKRFMEDLKTTVKSFGLYSLEERQKGYLDTSLLEPYQEYLGRIGASPDLASVLTAMNPLFGIEPEDCPRYIYQIILDSFLNSAWRLDERKMTLHKAFRKILEEIGGEILCGKRVVEILTEKKKVLGVRLENGDSFSATRVIFTGHPQNLLYLCKGKCFRPIFRQRLLESRNTPGIFGIALQWKDSSSPMAKRDYFLYQSWNTSRQYFQKPFSNGDFPHLIYCAGAPFPDKKGIYPTVALCSLSQEETLWLKKLRKESGEKAYQEKKKEMGEKIFQKIQKRWPQAADKMQMVDVFTPLTIERYTLSPYGSAYGLKKGVSQFHQVALQGRTKIENLFLAGQSVILSGILGSIISSVYVCDSILGPSYLISKIRKAVL
ncbi:MAG: NAD(P)/FAD-dependent oxidoreductase [Planctomycetota bacterium]|nr:MAG: NAD(P)/FAD-dependent oxidoreductase [Planctomycetota bacterium]